MATSLNTSRPVMEQNPVYRSRLLSVTANKTLTVEEHDGMTCVFDVASGATVTLPPATGSGARFEFFVKTTVTSNSAKVQVTGDDTMSGVAVVATDNAADAVIAFETAVDSDTITLNGSTTGGIKGDRIVLQDVAADLWMINAITSATGVEVTPFSAAVT